MIKAVYHRKYHRLKVEGHAKSGEEGHDLVCAAATILVHTLAASVAKLSVMPERVIRDPVIKTEKGSAEISCKPVNRFNATVTMIYDSICNGYELLARDYPENIIFEIRE